MSSQDRPRDRARVGPVYPHGIRFPLVPWQRVEMRHVVGVSVFAVVLTALRLASGDGWTPIFDSANLAFHEAGHLIYGVFGRTAALYGGVLGQLTLPIVLMVTFWLRREPAGVATGGVWAGQNLFNIARYMADARAQELPLVGGGEHDFTNIFTRWHVLHRDVAIAGYTRALGWIAMAGAIGWLVWRFRRADDAGE